MANFPDLRPGERSAEAERVAVQRSASPLRLAALAAVAAAILMAVVQLGAPGRSAGPPAFLTNALGTSDASAPLVRRPAPGVELGIDRSGFRLRSGATAVTLETQGAAAGDWHRFENGVSRPTPAGVETILVDGHTLEQFLTVEERQGLRRWRWRIDSTHTPRVGDDGAVAFLDTKLHKLTDVSIAPVSILDWRGRDVTPAGLRWGLEQRNDNWWLTLRLDDANLPLPYVIDPAVTHRNSQTGTAASGTSVSVTKPTGVQANDLLVAHVAVTGNVTASLAGSGWTAITSGTAGNAATQGSFYKIAGGSEPASYSFTWTGSHAAAASVSAYYGVKSSAPFDLFSTIVSSNNTTTVTANSLTTTANDDIVLGFFASASNSTYTPPGGWNERADVGVAGVSGSVADKVQATAGATGNASATATVSARVYGHQAAFFVDNVAPSVTMTDPGSPVTGTITLQTSAASDTDSYVESVQFQRSPAGAGSWTNVGSADTTSPYSVSFDTTAVSDGLYDFRAVATDGAGNTGNSATISNREIDNTAPSSTTTFPASGGAYNTSGWNAGCATNGFCGTYSDSGSGVQKVEISIRRGTGNYWSAGSFSSGSEVWNTTSLSAGNWSHAFPASNFPTDDSYTIRVKATDNAGNGETPSSRSFTYDTVAPDTSISANPADPTTSTSANFSFTSTEGGSSFECQVDGGGYSSCTSPKSYAGPLSDGSHTFLVRATDAAGNTDGSAASFTWTVDTTAPSSTTTFPASGGAYNTSGWNAGCATNGFCGTYSDSGSGVQKVEISIRRGTGNYWSAGSFSSGSEVWNTTSLSAGNWSHAFPASNFPTDDSYTIRVKATDNAGNGETPSSRSFTFDTVAAGALISFPAPAGDYTTVAWNAGCATNGFCGTYTDATSGVQKVELSIRQGAGDYWDGSSFASGSEVWSTATLAGGSWSYAFPAESFPADGQYTVHVRAKDNASNTETGPSGTFRIDNTNPSALFTFPASDEAYNDSGWNAGCATNGFCGSASDTGSGVQAVDIAVQRVDTGLYWNGTSFASGSEDFQAANVAGGGWSYVFPASSFPIDGTYTVHIRARDSAGNVETGPSRSFTIDNAAPATTLDSGPSDPSASADATFTFSSSEGGSTFECELDGAGHSSCSSPKSYASLADGGHTFKVRATDQAGNTDASPAQSSWTVDTTAPNSTVAFPAAAGSYRTSTWNAGCGTSGFCGTYSDATSGVQKVEVSIKRVGTGLYWNGSAFASGSESFFGASLAAGDWSYAFGAADFPAADDYTVRVKATDNTTNAETPSSRTFTFDATDPTGSLTAPATGAVVSGAAVTVSSDSADAGSGVDLATFERRASGGGSWMTIAVDATAPYSVSWDTTSGTADGDYELRVTTTDRSGNSLTSATRTVTVDNTAPTSATLDALPAAIRNGQALTGSGADAGSGITSIAYYSCAGPPCSPGSLIGTSSTGPSYSSTWGSQPADGDYQVLARVSDGAGNTLDSAKQTVTIDNTDPVGSLTAPADGAQVSATATVSSDSADAGSGVAGAAFQHRPSGGGAWTTIATDTTAPYSVDWDTTPLGDGDYDLRVVTTDAAGNAFTSATRTVRVDNQAPTVAITAPGAYVNGAAPDPFTVTATSSDTDVASVELFACSNQSSNCGTGSWTSLGAPDTTAPYTGSWDVRGDGNQALRAVVSDSASNTGSDVVNTTVDRADPTGSLTAPGSGAFLSGTVAVSSDSADSGSGVASAAFERRPAGGGAWVEIGSDTTAPYSVSWDTSALNGDFDLHVVTADAAGNQHTSATRTLTVDNTAPSAPVISLSESSVYAFVSGATVYVNTGQSGTYDVDATSSDAQSGIEKIRFPGPVDDSSSPYGTSYAFGDLSGSQTVTAYSNAGLTASDTFTVTPDTAAPSTTDDTGTLGSAWRNASVTVTLTPIDGGAGVAATHYTIDGSIPTTSSAEGTSVNLTSDGVYTVKYFSVDRVGNAEPVRTAGTQIRIDLTNPSAPALTLTESSPFAHVSGTTIYVKSGEAGTYTLSATSNDAGSGIDKVRFPGGVDDSASPYQAVYALDDLAGSQTVTAFDSAGNTDSSGFDVAADDVAPSGGSVTYPDGYDADGQVAVSTADGTDALSGVDAASGVLERRTSALTDGSCAGFSGGWSTVTSPDTVATATCAQYRHRISDRVGNEAIYTSGNVVKVDQTTPDTSIDSVPSDPTNATGASFTFSATEAGSTYECELDGGGFSACPSPKSYSGLADGSHTFEVRATDEAGNTDASPAQFTWTVDTTAPNTTIDASPPDPDSNTSPSFQFSANEGGATYECQLDGGGFSACASPKAYSSLPDGSHTFEVRATDPAGNADGTPASYIWVVNAADPSVAITAPSGFVNLADADPFTVTATSPDGDVADIEFFRCSDASAGCSSGSWISLGAPDATAPYTASWSLPADGNASLRAVATDLGSNTGASVVDVTVDRTRPVGSIDSAPPDPTSATGATFLFSANEGGANFQCRLDGGSFTSCASPKSYSSLSDGSHTFEVEATDPAGNLEAAPQSFTWTEDTAAPNTSITSNPSDPSSSAGASFDFTSSEGGSTFECELDGGGFADCTSPGSYTGLADGSHTFKVRATDAAGNTDASPAVYTWTIDATAPAGGLTDPGSPLRGTVSLSASPSDTDAGVQDVQFQVSPANAGTWSTISSDATAPYTAPWDTSADVDGLYDLRIVVTDNALNSSASTVVEDRLVDNTNPTATMNDPGAALSGTVNLTSTAGDTGSGIASVTYQRSPAGAGTWTVTPASWNTTAVADGLYDLRVVVTDNAGNSTISPAVPDRRVDNDTPTLSSSIPADGSKIAAAASLTVTASEDLAGLANATIDGMPVGGGVVAGSTVTYTQPFGDGPHTLAAELEDLAGNRTPIRVHFTVWSATGGDYPYIEKNSFAASAMTLAATNGDAQATVPAGAWSGAPTGDWLVLKIDPRPAGPVSSGFEAVGDIYDVSAYWALAGTAVAAFDEPLDLTMTNGAGTVLPAVLDGGAWRPAAQLTGTTLPSGSQDGFYKVGDTIHLLTRATSSFTLLRDNAAPTRPGGFKGSNKSGRLVLEWTAATDNSGLVDAYLVYANGALVQTLGSTARSADMGAFSQKDARSFQVAARDAAGNVSPKTGALVVVPKVAKQTVTQAKSTLKKRGLKAGRLSYVYSSLPKGRVVAATKTGLVAKGTAVPLKVSKGRRPSRAPTGSNNSGGTTTSYYAPGTTPPPISPAPGTVFPTDTSGGSGEPAEPDGSAAAGGAEPESFNPDGVSRARRVAGLVLLGTLFAGAAAMVVRARRRLVAPFQAAASVDEPILFWDQRLARAAVSAFRRLAGR